MQAGRHSTRKKAGSEKGKRGLWVEREMRQAGRQESNRHIDRLTREQTDRTINRQTDIESEKYVQKNIQTE